MLNITNALNNAIEEEQRPDAGWIRASELPTDSDVAQELAKAKQTLGDRNKTCVQLLAEKQALEAEIAALRGNSLKVHPFVAPSIVAPKLTLTKGQDYHFGNYDWSVLAVEGSKALLLAKSVVEHKAYNISNEATTWGECTLEKYLNGTFYEHFPEGDRGRILQVRNSNPKNPWYNTRGGADTTDHIFLLSIEEVFEYFGTYTKIPTKTFSGRVNDAENDARTCSDLKGEASWWWLRSPGYSPYSAARVNIGGFVHLFGIIVNDSSGGVRPALWLNLES
jgi:hypothetical protein